jgi:precorrin-2/cobalt-factor-2 C20-methyltransferase
MSYTVAQPGVFYAVGIGPGSPDLLTVRAVNLIRSADVIVAPRSRLSDDSMALQAAAPYLRGEGQEIVEHVYAMERDTAKTLASWGEIAQRIQAWLQQGKSVVQITLGDPLIYSTSHYLLSGLRKLGVPESSLLVVPGISAFQATAARISQSLTIQRGRMTIMSADDVSEVREALRHCETLVVYKSGKHVEALRNSLREAGVLDQAVLACYVEQDNEFVCRDLANLDPETMPGYLSTLIVFQGERAWHGQD